MADRIEWFLNANASQVRAEMSQTVQAVNSGTNQIVQGYNRADLATGNLLKSNARVGHQIANVSQSLISGADAGNVFAVSMEAIGRSLKLGLGAISSLFVGGLIIGEITKAAQAAAKLREEVAALTAPSPDARFQTLDKLASKLEEVHKKTREVKAQGFWAAVGAGFGDLFSGNALDLDESGNWKPGSNLPMNRRTGSLEREASRLMKGIAEHRRRENDADVAGGFAGDRMKAYQGFLPKMQAAFFEKNFALAAEEMRAYGITIKKINEEEQAHLKKIQDEKSKGLSGEAASFKEKLQLSLADIAKGGLHARDRSSFDNTKQYAGDVAEQALKEEALAKKAILKQDYAGAVQHQSMAETLKAQIPGLKDSEKIATFKSALDTSERLREIRDRVSFAGK